MVLSSTINSAHPTLMISTAIHLYLTGGIGNVKVESFDWQEMTVGNPALYYNEL